MGVKAYLRAAAGAAALNAFNNAKEGLLHPRKNAKAAATGGKKGAGRKRAQKTEPDRSDAPKKSLRERLEAAWARGVFAWKGLGKFFDARDALKTAADAGADAKVLNPLKRNVWVSLIELGFSTLKGEDPCVISDFVGKVEKFYEGVNKMEKFSLRAGYDLVNECFGSGGSKAADAANAAAERHADTESFGAGTSEPAKPQQPQAQQQTQAQQQPRTEPPPASPDGETTRTAPPQPTRPRRRAQQRRPAGQPQRREPVGV